MGLLEKIFGGKPHSDANGLGYQTFTEYEPVFTTWSGSIIEQELTRAAIERFATACSKLRPDIYGNANPQLTRAIHTQPNDMMTWSSFLNRVATCYETDGTAVVVPVFSKDYRIIGFFPLKFSTADVIDLDGTPWVKFYFDVGEPAALKLSEVCIISKLRYESDVFGAPNCLGQTMQLIHAQAEAQENAIENSAKIRFIGQLQGQVREDDMEKKRKRFIADNLSASNEGGLMVYDATWANITPIKQDSYVISPEEMKRIQDNVYNYFGTNEKILQNSYDEDEWSAYYEGKVEPFAIALGEGLTSMCFTPQERYSASQGLKNGITFSSSRLEYASINSKIKVICNMVDRGLMSINQALEVMQLPPVEDGDTRVIRGEYVNVDSLKKGVITGNEGDLSDDLKSTEESPNSYDTTEKTEVGNAD